MTITFWVKYYTHRSNAKKSGIPFLLTFEEWFWIWYDSGHLHERGCRKGQYVMARYGDKGPYAVGNVRVITHAENQAEANVGKKHTLKSRMNNSLAHLGKFGDKPALGRRPYKRTKPYVRGKSGWVLSLETKMKMSRSQRNRYSKERRLARMFAKGELAHGS
jgi:hypothetical protein